LKFLISPDFRFTAHAHVQDFLEGRMKPGDPALLSGRQGLIVDVGVTDEEVLFEIHRGTPVFGL
jgi:hypothetical protein